jgi:hypothetical protein
LICILYFSLLDLPKFLAKTMKKSILITLLLIPFLGFSQTTKPIEGFLGIKFGTSKADVIAAIQAKGGALSKSSTADVLVFNGVSLGHRNTAFITANFFEDKLYMGVFYFKPELEAQTIEFYDGLVSDISDVYGKVTPYKSFKSPYEDGDGHEILALSSGNATFFTNWGATKGNLLQATINPIDSELYVRLLYIDTIVQAQANAARKAKEKSDY